MVAIGGNALSPSGESATVANQFRHTRESLVPIVGFATAGWRVAVVHGNGPQVGDELIRNEEARARVHPLPLGVLVAATAGWIGYMIQQSLQNALRDAGSEREVVTLVTQVRVDPDDPAFGKASKFIGRRLDAGEGERLRERGWEVGEDPRGHLRRIVPSPAPVEIVEAPAIAELLREGKIAIAAGGGGIPVYRDPTLGMEGVDAVVDKDRAAALLAEAIGARILLILTDVDAVYRSYGTAEAKRIERLDPRGSRRLLATGELGEGSMRPKVEAAISFVERGGERAVIAALPDASDALEGRAGTEIRPG